METGPSTDAPIACTLESGDFKERLGWIAELNRAALLDTRREGMQLVLSYRPDHADNVRELVRREQQCCAFLNFDLKEERGRVILAIEAPEGATEALDAIFEPFLTARPPRGGCRCGAISSGKGEDNGCG